MVGQKFKSKINGKIFVVRERFTAENKQDCYIVTDEPGEFKTAISCEWFEQGIMQNLERI